MTSQKQTLKEFTPSIISAILIALLFLFITPFFTKLKYIESDLDQYVKYFYNRYTLHFDKYDLKYSSPTYGIKKFKTPQTPREWLALSSYYKYRALEGDETAKKIINQAIIQTQNGLFERGEGGQSFEDAQAQFLALRMYEIIPHLLDQKKQADLLNMVNLKIEDGIKSPDEENRALVASVHWQYLVNFLDRRGVITEREKNYYNQLIKKDVDNAIDSSMSSASWYFEKNYGQKFFSPHYQAISAFMLMIYGHLTNQEKYLTLAEKMYYNIKRISFSHGFTEARIGHRPIGLGAQFYLAQGLLGKYFADDDYKVYLNFASSNQFFSDPNYPNRLEFHSTLKGTNPNFHDDYALSDIAELGLIIPELRKIDPGHKSLFTQPIGYSSDENFKIINTGDSIIINNKKFILDSSGNQSILVK